MAPLMDPNSHTAGDVGSGLDSGTRIEAQYGWQTCKDSVDIARGSQASKLRLVKKTAAGDNRVYICKYYSCANLSPDSIRGLKYVRREWKISSSLIHPHIVHYENFAF